MKNSDALQGRKRPVNLFLSEDLVAQARTLTDNLSAEVESLLAAFVQQQRELRDSQADRLRRSALAWNHYAEKRGSFADEFSTL